ncbi:UDP-N-acetylmuramate dehydrogenase [Kerstersia gyiorum]|uniref:UDP-N-acetylenolpyruvoylglucosamine reductase n=1 Tax=Kerstersia gyiorum TaxID=206506 RepID=A0A171KPG9_9BURK|nr:UDP-N-acetylenolpyruvoylglucosamine reductase [Kerstersia gyiorum]
MSNAPAPLFSMDPAASDMPVLVAAAQDLRALNTLGLPARAAAFVSVTDAAQLPALSRLVREYASTLVLGGGSNLVLPDEVDGLVVAVRLPGVRHVGETDTAILVEAAAGESWHGLVQWCVAQGLGGLENLALIPGTVGAAPVQNIGAYGLEVAERLVQVHAWDIVAAERVVLPASECGFAYRDSRFKQAGQGRWLIMSVVLALPKVWAPRMEYPDLQRYVGLKDKPAAGIRPQDVFDAVCAVRRAKLPDPAVLGNAGSFFKNPVVSDEQADALQQRFPDMPRYRVADGRSKLAAGWLIDRCGWKGRALGPVAMHERQALVMVNRGGARAADVLRLEAVVRADVQMHFGVALEREPILAPGRD